MREVNRLQEMEVFLAVLDEGSFSAAALRRQMTPSAVSKMMTRLESRLGATLLRRTTRRVQVTDEGLAFARAARDVLATLDQAEREVGCGPVAGVVRIATSAAYANHILAPVLPELLCAHRDLDLGLIIGDAITDLSGSRSIWRSAPGRCRIPAFRRVRWAWHRCSAYRHPAPRAERIGFGYARRDPLWRDDTPRLRATDGNTIAQLAAAGCGSARPVPSWSAQPLKPEPLKSSPAATRARRNSTSSTLAKQPASRPASLWWRIS